jgi:peroxiredoxin
MWRFNIFLLSFSLLLSCGRSEKKPGDAKHEKAVSDKSKNERKLEIGAIAANFSLPSQDGKLIQLSDFRGKYVFLDFWASWCLPCRASNPELVKVYEKFRGPNFEILGVSLDKKREAWTKAIKKDGLEWVHVSDLKYFDSEMIQLYNITNVPMTYLLDPEGTIIAQNIHVGQLEQLLVEVL